MTSQLEQDLIRYKDEVLTKRDIVAGLELIGEITGIVGLIAAFGSLLTALPAIVTSVGLPASVAASATGLFKYRVIPKLPEIYANLPAGQRKLVRSAMRYVNMLTARF